MHLVLISLIALLFSVVTFAAEPPASFTYQGRVFRSDGITPLESSTVVITIQIRSPDGLCLLFEETHARDMSGSGGMFSVSIGDGTNTNASGLNLKQVFDNSTAKVGAASCAYTPITGDTRRIRFSYNDGVETVTLPTDQTLRSVPYALNAATLQGATKDKFLQVSAQATQAKVDTIFSYYTELNALAAGTSTQYVKASDLPFSGGVLNVAGSGVKVADTPIAADHAINKNYADTKLGGATFDTTGLVSGQVMVWNSVQNKWQASSPTVGTLTSVTAGTGLSGGTITGTGTISMPNVGVVGSYTKVSTDAQGRVTSGSNLSASDIPAPAGDIGGTYAALAVQKIQGVSVSNSAPTANQLLAYNATSLKWEPQTFVGNISQLKGTALVQQFPTNCTASQTLIYNFVSDSFVCTSISVSAAQVTGLGSAAGLAVGTTAGTVAAGNDARLTGAVQASTAASGDLSGTWAAPVVSKIKGIDIAAGAPASGQVLKFDSVTGKWEFATDLSNVGTVTSVVAGSGLTGGTITSSGALSVSFGTTAGTVAAGNDTRIVNALQPGASVSGDLSGTWASPVVNKIRGVDVASGTPTNGQVLKFNSVSSQWEYAADVTNLGTVTSVVAGTGLTGGTISSSGTVSVDFGTTAGKVAAGNDTRIVNALQPSDVGTSANKLVQLDSSGKLPVLDGSNLTNLAHPTFNNMNMQVFDSSGTWTPPAGVTKVYVQIWGAGGGGAGGSSAISNGGGTGGSGGAYAATLVTLSSSAGVTVTVGAAGVKGGSNSAGSNGGNSSFGAYITANGGAGGVVNGTTPIAGAVSTALMSFAGGFGLPPYGAIGGAGGAAQGGAAAPGSYTSATGASNGASPGCGGGGGYGILGTASGGGHGASGRVVIWY